MKVAASVYLEGAKDFKAFSTRMRQKFGGEIPEDVMQAAFEKGVDKYQRNLQPLDAIKEEIMHALSASRRDGAIRAIGAIRKAGLLTGPRTLARNIIGNTASAVFEEVARIPGGVADMVMGAVTGQRTTAMIDPRGIVQGVTSAVTKGVKDSIHVLRTGGTPEDLAKYDVPKELNWYVKNTRVPIINEYVNWIGRAQSTYDRPFREYAFKRSIVEQAQLVARAEKAGAERVKELVRNPTEEMARQAIADSEQAIFANANHISDAFNRWKASSEGARFTLDMVVPFVRTPTNIGGRTLESTPIGIVKAGKDFFKLKDLVKAGAPTQEMQRQIAREFGRGASGTALMGLGYWLYEQGVVSPGYSPDKAERDRQEATGVSPGSIKIKDTWHQLRDSPAGALVVMGATIAAGKKKSGASGAAVGAGKAFVGTTLEQPMLQGAKEVTDIGTQVMRAEDTAPAGLKKIAGQMVGSFVPTAVADARSVGDRTIRRGTGLGDVAKQRAQGKDSGLPINYDALGRPLQRSGLIDPTEGRTERKGAVERELERLQIPLTKAQRVNDKEKAHYDRDDADYQARVKFVGEAVRKHLERVVSHQAFQRLDDKEKAKALEDQIQKVKQKASADFNSRRAFERK